eukprot:gene19703-biopygen7003
MDDRPCARGGNCRATATTATATTATATTTTRAWSAPGRVPVCTWTGLRGMPWRNGDPPAASIGDRYRHGAAGWGGGRGGVGGGGAVPKAPLLFHVSFILSYSKSNILRVQVIF